MASFFISERENLLKGKKISPKTITIARDRKW
jgi:hypothetical protein